MNISPEHENQTKEIERQAKCWLLLKMCMKNCPQWSYTCKVEKKVYKQCKQPILMYI